MPALTTQTSVPLSPTIFKAYDIRGIIAETLDACIAARLGWAFGMMALSAGEHTVVTGRDGRLSSPLLSRALAQGLQTAGVHVLDIGQVTTPMVYFAMHELACQTHSGIMVTGSHNPKNHNGFKMVLAGQAMYGQGIQQLYAAMHKAPSPVKNARTDQTSLWSAYRDRIISDIHLARPMKIIIDCGNGVAGAFAGELYRALGCQVQCLFCEVDGRFPHHHPDPAHPDNLVDLIKTLQNPQTQAELGLAFDGDGDRLGVVTKTGQIINPDRQLMLFAADVLKSPRHQTTSKPTVLYDVKCTRHLAPWITQHGGTPLMCKTGHSLIKAKMRQTNALLAGEMSGHLFFNDRWYGFDDGLYAGARLLEILSRTADPSRVLHALPMSLSTPEWHLPCHEGENITIIHALQDKISRHPDFFPGMETMSFLDGVRVEYPDGFGLARASNTTPVIVMRFEADSPAALQRIQKTFKAAIFTVKPDVDFPEN